MQRSWHNAKLFICYETFIASGDESTVIPQGAKTALEMLN
jgi:hypothetical protein